jgi:hypothetical protein
MITSISVFLWAHSLKLPHFSTSCKDKFMQRALSPQTKRASVEVKNKKFYFHPPL